ncbi:hypothetical protein ACFONH_08345, partial [Streptomonospora nanhaiensis]|uniref:hypothetical protein n=3 Tax=Streptomonospora nanhaiensis TaxID=1323731 RepID=UPI0036155F35
EAEALRAAQPPQRGGLAAAAGRPGAPAPEEQPPAPAPRRSRRGQGDDTGGRRRAAAVDPVSRFSASALRRVSVLGDRPNQVVANLAEHSTRRRGTVVLATLLALCCVSLVALLGVLAYQLTSAPESAGGAGSTAIVEPPEGHSTLVPTLYQGDPEGSERFAPIAERSGDAKPMAEDQVFAKDSKKLELNDYELVRGQTEVTDTCTAMVWGDAVAQALVDGACGSAAGAVFRDPDEDYIAQFTLFDLDSAESAGAVSAALDPQGESTEAGFVLPMDTEVRGLQEGYSQATTQVMGHYLAVYWVARADGAPPGDDEHLSTLNVLAMDASTWVYRQVRDAEEGEGS